MGWIKLAISSAFERMLIYRIVSYHMLRKPCFKARTERYLFFHHPTVLVKALCFGLSICHVLSFCSFVWTDIVTVMSHERLEQFWYNWRNIHSLLMISFRRSRGQQSRSQQADEVANVSRAMLMHRRPSSNIQLGWKWHHMTCTCDRTAMLMCGQCKKLIRSGNRRWSFFAWTEQQPVCVGLHLRTNLPSAAAHEWSPFVTLRRKMIGGSASRLRNRFAQLSRGKFNEVTFINVTSHFVSVFQSSGCVCMHVCVSEW